ncbi:MAG: amidohydrolase family protein, partial [Lachnospiraceae bacterium]|nr:amidohydrolase family protein [Lachnospiraceae bacterium]
MKVDYIIKDAWVYQTFRQCFEKREVAVSGERILAVSPKFAGACERIIDGSGMYLIPGLIDIHMHIESSMTYPKEFSRLALQHGTTTVVADAHEIANVFGMEGIRSFMDQETELDIFYAIPSSVPATNWELETPGAAIGEEETRQLLEDDRVLCLGEVMNFRDLVPEEPDGLISEPDAVLADKADTKTLRLIRLCRSRRGRDIRIEGHCPKITGMDLNRFIFAGVDADHTQQTPESVLEKSDLGMFLELQRKSLTPEVVEAVCSHRLYENVALITDDTMPDQLLEGQLNRILLAAVQAGMPVEKAIYCATYTPARRMHLDDRGIIGPGKLADFLLLQDLDTFRPAAVVKSG